MTSIPQLPAVPRYFILFVAALIALGPFAIDTYLPALPKMAEALGVDIVRVNNTLSIYLFGFAFGQIVGGPVSDQIGRRPIGIAGLIIFIVTSLLIAQATSISQVLWLRGIQAFGGGFATVICMAMVRDAFSAQEAARKFPKVMLVMLTAPLVAPAIGAALLSFGWASIFVFLAVYAALMLLCFTQVPETAVNRVGKFVPSQIFPQYFAVLSFRDHGKLIGLRWILSQGFLSSLMLVFITNSSFIYLQHYAVAENRFVFFFAANVVAMMIGTSITSRLIYRLSPFRLYTTARWVQFGSVVVLTILVVLIDLPVWVFTPLLALCIGCAGMIGPSVQGMYLAPFGKLSGSATSLMSMSMFLFGSILGVVSGWFYDGTLMPIVMTMLAALLIGNLIAMTIPAPNLAESAADH
jgi:DHA1 family bicyclomycin/chloramphenicol resistance-like MFS transporter